MTLQSKAKKTIRHLNKIHTKIPNTDRIVNIDLAGKNLIITGVNGCGKTQLLKSLHSFLEEKIVNKQSTSVENLENNLKYYNTYLSENSEADANYSYYKTQRTITLGELVEAKNPPISIDSLESLVIDFHNNKSVFMFFNANRQANIKESKSAASKADLIKQASNISIDAATLFEEFLVSHITSLAYAESISVDNNPLEADKIKTWFKKLNSDFRDLFEDDSLNLEFNSKEQTFFIHQNNRTPYRLQQLSSGFSSILSVYASLLTKVELTSVTPNEVTGIIFIDEIDAHLHVSLQRKILSFLSKSFPNVQFIVTTHSPFVVSSVSNAVIYDLSSLEQVDDLSMYSYESILDGLFNVLPISESLQEKMLELTNLINNSNNLTKHENMVKITKLVADITPHESKLDSESAFFFKTAKLHLSKVQSGVL